MGQIIEDLLKDVNIQNKEEIISIKKKEQNKYRLISTKR